MRNPLNRCALSLICTFSAAQSHAGAELSFDSSGFLRQASDRAAMSTAVTIRPDIEVSSARLRGNLDIKFATFLSDSNSYGWEIFDTYVSTNKNWLNLHEVTAGRRGYDWLKLDQHWQLGVMNPRFLWDPLHPENVGLTGVFYAYERGPWRVLAFGSPVSLPEHGAPVQNRDNRIFSADPLWNPPIASVPLAGGQNVPNHYSIAYPSVEELVLHPGVALQARYQAKTGLDASLTFADLPIHQPDLVSTNSFPASGSAMETRIRPRILRHQLISAEVGYQEPETSIWSSITLELPKSGTASESEVARSVGRTWIGAAGADLFRRDRYQLSAAYVLILEDKVEDDLATLLPDRYNYRHAARLRLGWRASPRLLGNAQWTRDLQFSGDLVSLDLSYRPSARSFDQQDLGWVFGIGMDLMRTPNGLGFVGQFEGDDRIRVKVSYAF